VILNQVIEASKGLKPPIMNSIKIILKPAHLGELRLEVKQLDDHMRVKLEVDSQTVKEVLDKNSQAIRDSLRQQGLDVDRIEVELRQQKQDQQEQQAEQEAKDSDSKKNKDNKEFSLEDELAETLVPEDVLDHQGTQVKHMA
jgi:flagellar hook-length control protein FliK